MGNFKFWKKFANIFKIEKMKWLLLLSFVSAEVPIYSPKEVRASKVVSFKILSPDFLTSFILDGWKYTIFQIGKSHETSISIVLFWTI